MGKVLVEFGDMIKGDKISLQAGYIKKPKGITLAGHHSYTTTGEDNASAWIDKPFQFVKQTPIKK